MGKTTSTVYLLHFDRRYKHAGHYLGSASDLEGRLKEHRAGQGARLLAVVVGAGISFELARTWPGDRKTEKRLKRQHQACRLCPLCNPGNTRGRNP